MRWLPTSAIKWAPSAISWRTCCSRRMALAGTVYLTGDGDSYHAACAAAMAFETIAGLRASRSARCPSWSTGHHGCALPQSPARW